MTDETLQPDIAKINHLLLEAFTPEDLRRFCRDRPTFRRVTKRFGRPYRLDDMVDELIAYCETRLLFPELLAELKQHNPRQYARFVEPTPPTPDILTISHPIALQLVRVPAGEFQMGSVVARDKHTRNDELPPHRVHIPEFHIGQYPVTNRQYGVFVHDTKHREPIHWVEGQIPWDRLNHPVTWVGWEDAVAFCKWLSRKTKQPFRLPTEAEWEKAARGTDGRIYPWGDDPPNKDRCNFGENVGDTTIIGCYSPQGDSPYGCTDMAGNVNDWCQSLYTLYPYQADDGREDPKSGGLRVYHGGSWRSDSASVRCARRHWELPGVWYVVVGFRVARGPLG